MDKRWDEILSRYNDLWNKLAPIDDKHPNNGMTQKRNEIMELWSIFERVEPTIILEIGVSQGGTFAGWCQLASDDALIIGIDRDPNDCYPRKGNQVHPDIGDLTLKMTEEGGGMYALKRKGSHQTIVPIVGMSFDPIVIKKLKGVLNGRKIDFIFHDASHEYSMTVKDFELYWPLVAPGGVMAFHDIAYYSGKDINKWRWWREILRFGPYDYAYTFEHNDRKDLSMGIGVLFKKVIDEGFKINNKDDYKK